MSSTLLPIAEEKEEIIQRCGVAKKRLGNLTVSLEKEAEIKLLAVAMCLEGSAPLASSAVSATVALCRTNSYYHY